MIDPTFKSISGDKAGKDSNFRGLTDYNGSLYFTKGSGSNGIDTVYTVSDPNGQLPTSATASQRNHLDFARVSHRPRQDRGQTTLRSASSSPIPTTLYVADEGTGDATDQTDHAGLEKWTSVERDLVARLYVAGGSDRRHL